MRSAQMVLTAIALFLTQQALAFDSGSTGADGAFNPTVDSEITLPADGVFNFTELNIPPGVTVTFTPNALNTPVTILVSGDAIIDGVIDINGFSAAPSVGAGNGGVADDGLPGRGGPGGFAGGHGGAADVSTTNAGARVAQSGFGPGGGIASTTDLNNAFCYGSGGSHATRGEISDSCSPNLYATAYGNADLLPLTGESGESGGSGGHGSSNGVGSGGGGGGGALLIAASGTLTINGQITADGGYGGDLGHEQQQDFGTVGAGGAGGGIRLVAGTIDGSGVISAVGGAGGGFVNTTPDNADGGDGRIRLEAEELLFTQRTNPPFSTAEPGELFASGLPAIRIDALVERDGIAVADYSGDDLGQGGSGLRLTSLGRIYAADSSSRFTVWRIRNSRDSKATVTLDAYGTGFSRQFLLPARSETFFASEIVAGAATHRLFEAGSQVSVKAAGNQPFAYEAPVEDSWGDINSCQVLGHA